MVGSDPVHRDVVYSKVHTQGREHRVICLLLIPVIKVKEERI